MDRWIVEQLNGSSGTARKVKRRFPEDEVWLATAVTMLETPEREPVGWSPRRLLQRRGNAVFTDRRLFLESSFFSGFTLVWLGFMGYLGYLLIQDRSPALIGFIVVAGLLIWQRRPYSRAIDLAEVEKVALGSVQGLSARGDIFAIVLPETTIQLVTAKKLSPDLVQQLETLVPRIDGVPPDGQGSV